MKFEYVVCKDVDGYMNVYIPEYKGFAIEVLSRGTMSLEEAEKVASERGGEVVKMMVEDAKGFPCFVMASHYPDGIID